MRRLRVLCPCFILVEKKAKADDLMPFDDLVVDKTKCDYAASVCLSALKMPSR